MAEEIVYADQQRLAEESLGAGPEKAGNAYEARLDEVQADVPAVERELGEYEEDA